MHTTRRHTDFLSLRRESADVPIKRGLLQNANPRIFRRFQIFANSGLTRTKRKGKLLKCKDKHRRWRSAEAFKRCVFRTFILQSRSSYIRCRRLSAQKYMRSECESAGIQRKFNDPRSSIQHTAFNKLLRHGASRSYRNVLVIDQKK